MVVVVVAYVMATEMAVLVVVVEIDTRRVGVK